MPAPGEPVVTRPTVAVLVDALGWELVRGHDFLEDLCPRRNPVRTILGYSSAAIPSLLTGEDPCRTRMWSLFYRSPGRSPFAWTKLFTWLPRPAYENRYVRRLVRATSRALSGYNGYFYTYDIPVKILQELDVSERRSIYRPGAFDQGCRSLFDRLEAAGISFRSYSYHDGPDVGIVARAADDLRSGRPRFVFVYLSELDAALHRDIGSPEMVSGHLRRYDALLRPLYAAAAEVFREFAFHVFSDHGMTPVTGTFDLVAELGKTGLKQGADYFGLFDSTMARFWFHTPAAREKTAGALAGMSAGTVLDDAYLRSEGVLFDDRRYGELIFLMRPGTLIVPSHMGSTALAGMHGFDPEDRHSTAMYMTNLAEPPAVRHLKDIVGALLPAGDGRR